MLTKIKPIMGWCKRRVALCVTVMAVIIALLCGTGFMAVSAISTITITDGETTQTVKTRSDNKDVILKEAGIIIGADDKVIFQKSDDKASITIVRAFPVVITVGTNTRVVNMAGGTVGDALKKADITLNEHDICNLDITSPLTKGTYIDVVDIEYLTETYSETLPFTTKVVYSSSLRSGEKQITGGKPGSKIITVKKKLVNGALTETMVVSEEVVTSAVDQKTVIGTKKVPAAVKTSSDVKAVSSLVPSSPIQLDKNGNPVSYKKVMTFEATAYYANSSSTCSTGVKPRTGYIAVNPKIIPYGTKMYIKSSDGKYIYGYAVAADTGGFARSNPYQVDLFFGSTAECLQFGRRNVTIYFI